MMSIGDEPFLELNNRSANEIYKRLVLPRYGINAPQAQKPIFTIVGGQQGAGKTTVIEKLGGNRFIPEDVQYITVDNLMPLVPGYTVAAARDSLKAQGAVGNTAGHWGWKLMERAFANRNHIALELAFGGQVSDIAALAKSHGYKTELVVLAVHKDHSWNSVVARYARDLTNGEPDARFVSRENHQNAYDGWPVALQKAEQGKAFDSISVVDRDGAVFTKNELIAGNGLEQEWTSRPQAMETLMIQRHRPWTEEQRSKLTLAWQAIAESKPLARALPDQMNDFKIDQAAALAYGRSDASRYNVFARDAAISQTGISLWVKRFTQDIGTMVDRIKPEDRSTDLNERLVTLTKTVRSLTQGSYTQSASQSTGSATIRPSAENAGDTPRTSPSVQAPFAQISPPLSRSKSR